MDERKLSGLLGLACRAGQLVSGAEKALAQVREDKAALVLLDASTAANTRKKLTDSCGYRGITLLELPEGVLGQAIGRPGVCVAAIQPGGLSDNILHTITPGGDITPATNNILEGTRLNG